MVVNLFQNFNKAFESKVRLGIMSILMVNDNVDFSTLKDLLQVTDGNLASHSKALEELNYIKISKQFIGKNLTQHMKQLRLEKRLLQIT